MKRKIVINAKKLELFLNELDEPVNKKQIGYKIQKRQRLEEKLIWFSDETALNLAKIILQESKTKKEDEKKLESEDELIWRIILFQFFCDDAIDRMAFAVATDPGWKTRPKRELSSVMINDLFEMFILCLKNRLRIEGKLTSKSSVKQTSWSIITSILKDMKLRLVSVPNLQGLVEKKYSDEMYKVLDRKYETLNQRQKEYKKKLKRRIESRVDKYKSNEDFLRLRADIQNGDFTRMIDFKLMLKCSLHID